MIRADRIARRLWPGLLPSPPMRDNRFYTANALNRMIASFYNYWSHHRYDVRSWHVPQGSLVNVARKTPAGSRR